MKSYEKEHDYIVKFIKEVNNFWNMSDVFYCLHFLLAV